MPTQLAKIQHNLVFIKPINLNLKISSSFFSNILNFYISVIEFVPETNKKYHKNSIKK
jgi:hypothetical protein